jgi:hypothetical protein
VKIALLVFAFATSLFAQRDCGDHTLLVSAIDANGLPVKKLTLSDFRVSYRGRPLAVTSSQLHQDFSGRAIVLLDMSGSMKGNDVGNKWKIAEGMASDFVASAPPKMQVGLISFAGKVREQFEASHDRKAIQDWLSTSSVIAGREVKGETGLNDAILMAISTLSPAEIGDSIYVITDGGDNLSNAKGSTVERALIDSGIRLFAFLLYSPDITREEYEGPQSLDGLVHRSGGFLVGVGGRDKHIPGTQYEYNDEVAQAIKNSARLIQTQMADFYVLGIKTSDRSVKPKGWILEVVDAQGRKRKDISLAYSQSSVNCASPIP